MEVRRLNGAGKQETPHTLCAGHARAEPDAGASDSAWMAAHALAEIQS
jgi:hypothetical protein